METTFYTCQSLEDDGMKTVCGAKHKTPEAAERCLRSDNLAPGLFKQYEGQILECQGAKVLRVAKRFYSKPKVSIRGRTGSARAVWVEAPPSPAATAAPARR